MTKFRIISHIGGIFLLFVTPTITLSQLKTNIDLRDDGRVIIGSRLNYLWKCIRGIDTRNVAAPATRKLNLSRQLANELAGSVNIKCILIPSKFSYTDEAGEEIYIISKIFDGSTLPSDQRVSKSDFKILREFATTELYSKIELLSTALILSPDAVLGAEAVSHQLESLVQAQPEERTRALAIDYAGFLFSSIEFGAQKKTFEKYTEAYRKDYMAWALPEPQVYGEDIALPKVGLGLGYLLSQPSELKFEFKPDYLKLDIKYLGVLDYIGKWELTSPSNKRTTFLTAWYGPDLLILPENQSNRFSLRSAGGLSSYFLNDRSGLVKDGKLNLAAAGFTVKF